MCNTSIVGLSSISVVSLGHILIHGTTRLISSPIYSPLHLRISLSCSAYLLLVASSCAQVARAIIEADVNLNWPGLARSSPSLRTLCLQQCSAKSSNAVLDNEGGSLIEACTLATIVPTLVPVLGTSLCYPEEGFSLQISRANAMSCSRFRLPLPL